MADLQEVVEFLDRLLNTQSVAEPYASNGLQVEASTRVDRVGLAVDACWDSFTALSDCQLIVVHHGLFWPKLARLTGPTARAIGALFAQGSSLYASHLPLDLHPQVGNNAQIIAALDLVQQELFPPVGYLAEADLSLDELLQRVQQVIGPTRVLDFGPQHIQRLVVSSGQASPAMVEQALKAGAQALLTGEASHPIYHTARQAGLNVLLAGHYASETWGVRALGAELERQFDLQTQFYDHPSGF